ncbi:ATPase [Mycobacterium shimoidei]|uniref:ATPase n=1 Tax=Mycobacterium shimoidei TaxID=29313 RepID=A0A1E3TGH4_MYCSH|nr:ATPase [Mycobacterium shimoidei]MCV7260948.1 ATPase [Mycobacterium shimoidei]ODR13543.1 ATPase [Mycobacterium shimoidei]ORW76544.1 ATPase [Mycobacterium shimoidei]SRX93500.1 hypothetical protein MSP7336_01738 [Mycobacterium shimoidei]
MRVILAAVLLASALAGGPALGAARADSETCPPTCDKIPDTAWIQPRDIPLNSAYRWPSLARIAEPLTQMTPRFRFEELCATPVFPQDTRDFAVTARASVVNPQGQWQLQAQILHWRGDTARGGQNVMSVFTIAGAALRGCQLGSPDQSPSVTVDGPNRLAVVISGPVIMHTYLVAHPQSSTISTLALWSSGPPRVPWPVLSDDQVLDAMTGPLCEAYISSCG